MNLRHKLCLLGATVLLLTQFAGCKTVEFDPNELEATGAGGKPPAKTTTTTTTTTTTSPTTTTTTDPTTTTTTTSPTTTTTTTSPTTTTTTPTTTSGAITASIVPSRISGVAPLAVFFDASGTTAVGAANPFHTLGYQWNFGDALATWDTTGASKNLASGPVAAHVFESPGTYTVTLTVTNGVDNPTATATITVSNPDTVFSGLNTICVSVAALPVAGVGGCPAGATVRQSGDWPTIVNTSAAAGKRVLLKRGEIFTGAANSALLNKAGPGIIGAYGTGAKPVIRTTGITNSSNILRVSGISDDWRLMDLDIDGESDVHRNFLSGQGNFTLTRLLLLRIDAHDLGGGIIIFTGASTPAVPDQVFLVDSTITRIKAELGSAGVEASFWSGRRMGVLGNTFDDTTQGAAEHLIRVQYADRAVFSYNLLRKAHTGKEMFALRAPCATGACGPFGIGDPAATKFVVVSRNRIETNTYIGVQVDTAAINNLADAIIRDVIFESNWYPTQPGGGPCMKIRAVRVTVRNEICDLTNAPGTTGFQVFGPTTGGAYGSSDVWLYNNTVYSGGAQTNMILTSLQSPPVNNLVIRNNLVYGVKSTTTYVVTGGTGSTFVQDTNGIANPSFASTPATSPTDLALTSGSYAIGAGAAVPVFTDFFGKPRQAGSALDVGTIIPR